VEGELGGETSAVVDLGEGSGVTTSLLMLTLSIDVGKKQNANQLVAKRNGEKVREERTKIKQQV
jgi:hypothetical protein